MKFAFVNNDNLLTLEELRATAAQSFGYVNTASVFFTVVDSGESVGINGMAWPAAMTLVSSETGTWQATLADSLQMTEGSFYEALVTAVAGDGFKGYWKVPIKAIVRKLS